MPPFPYVLLHREARLSEADAIFQWTQTKRKRLIMENVR